VKYTRIVATADGSSRFEDAEFEMSTRIVVEGVPPMLVSSPVGVSGAIFVEQPEGATDWQAHVAPRRQFIFIVSGRVAVETSDGERREFGPGSVVSAEDTVGKGHVSTPLTDDVRLVMLPLTG